MRDPHDTTIDGRRYRVTPLAASAALRASVLFAHALGPGVKRLTSLEALDAELFAAVGEALERLSVDDVVALSLLLAETTQVELKPGELTPLARVYEEHFRGAAYAQAAWLAFAFRVSFESFFTKAAGLVGRPAASAAPTA